jgi:hypothetical protein
MHFSWAMCTLLGLCVRFWVMYALILGPCVHFFSDPILFFSVYVRFSQAINTSPGKNIPYTFSLYFFSAHLHFFSQPISIFFLGQFALFSRSIFTFFLGPFALFFSANLQLLFALCSCAVLDLGYLKAPVGSRIFSGSKTGFDIFITQLSAIWQACWKIYHVF